MRLHFLGTGTSMGVPVIGCCCAVCTSDDPRNHRLRTSALIQTGAETILIDAGPDFRTQALTTRLAHLDAVLLTHSHFDHTAGLDDLRPLCYPGRCVPIYGSALTLDEVRSRFAYAFDEASSSGSSRPSLELRLVEGPFMVGTTRIEPLRVQHGNWTINGYRIGGLGYITDANYIPAEAWALLGDLEVLVLNALRYQPHPTHYTVAEALEVIAALRPRQAYFVHMNHEIDHASASQQLPPGVAFAYDGLEVTIETRGGMGLR